MPVNHGLSRESTDSRSHVAIRDTHWPSPEPAASQPWLQAPNNGPFLYPASHSILLRVRGAAKGYRTYSRQVPPQACSSKLRNSIIPGPKLGPCYRVYPRCPSFSSRKLDTGGQREQARAMHSAVENGVHIFQIPPCRPWHWADAGPSQSSQAREG